MFFLNNVQNFEHAKHYGRDAFYDLRVDQEAERDLLREKEDYCVFSYEPNGSVALDYWTLTVVDEDARTIVDKGETFAAYALRGVRLDSKNRGKLPSSMTKEQFAVWKPNLFNKRGHFKQFSVAIPSWHSGEPRGGVIRADAA